LGFGRSLAKPSSEDRKSAVGMFASTGTFYEENCFVYFLADYYGFWVFGNSQQCELLSRPSSESY
jgi:hypothetical protein